MIRITLVWARARNRAGVSQVDQARASRQNRVSGREPMMEATGAVRTTPVAVAAGRVAIPGAATGRAAIRVVGIQVVGIGDQIIPTFRNLTLPKMPNSVR